MILTIKLLKQKKAQVDIQFNWIFILIVGAIILSFFVSVAIWYKGMQEQKINGEIVTKLDSLFTTAKESPRTARYTSIPKVSLTFTCDPNECSTYGCPSAFSGGGVSMPTETEVIFTRKNFEASNIITWSLEWNLPYKIANFLYLTHDGIRYVIVYDDAHANVAHDINVLLAENSYIIKESINIDNEDFLLINKNDAFVRIIVFADVGSVSEQAVAASLGDAMWDIIYVDGSEDVGTISYYDGNTPYISLPMLIGGIFSENAAFFNCNIYKAGIQARLVSSVYLRRTMYLEQYFNEENNMNYCTYYFGTDAQYAINSIQSGFNDKTIDQDLLNYVQILEDNNAYAVIKGCPRLY